MWKFDHKRFRQFISALRHLPADRQLVTFTFLLVTILYPGHNYLQRLVISPGEVRAYTIPVPSPVLYPVSDGVKAPGISARAGVVQDSESKTLVYAKNPDAQLLPASTTKLMTALAALDAWPDLDSVIEVKNEDRAIGQTIELVKGEQLTVRSLLYGLLVHSGNDAALALADNYCAPSGATGEVGPCGYEEFVKAMNARAQSLHLEHTTYRNPSGIEQYGHVTTARDLAILAGVAIQNPVIADVVATRNITIADTTGQFQHPLKTTNELLGVLPGIKGLKTGWTENAGECFVSVVERDGHQIVTVVLNSADRFGDTTRLVEWTYAHHEWIIPTL